MTENGNKSFAESLKIEIDFIPFHAVFRHFNLRNLPGDFAAAVNVALLAFPQGMAYALIAGLPLSYGIFGSAVASIAGAVFARSHFITLGPTNATSVLLLSAFAALEMGSGEKLAILPTIILLSGLFLVIGSMGKVASLIQYISKSVIVGYITAAAILIITNQLRTVLGIQLSEGVDTSTLVQVLWHTVGHAHTFNWQSTLIGLLTAGVFWSLNHYFRKLPNVAITLVIMSLVTYSLQFAGITVEKLNSVSMEEWNLTYPQFDLKLVRLVVGTSFAIAILSLLEGISIGKSLAARSGGKLDSNQEMFNLGFANLACAFLSGMPASGSLTRSMLNWRSGAKSPLATLIAGGLIVLAAFLLGPLLNYVPKTALSVLVISIGISLVNKHQIFLVTHSTGSDKFVFYATLVGGMLAPLDLAIYLGVGLSIFLFLRKAAAPELVEYEFNEEGRLTQKKAQEDEVLEISIVHVEGDLFFGSADLFRDQIRRIFEDKNLKILVLRMKNAHILDATCIMAMGELIQFMNEEQRHLIISGVRKKIYSVLERSGMLEKIGTENVFKEHPDNPTFSTALAMKRAQEILGGREANVTIYVKPTDGK